MSLVQGDMTVVEYEKLFTKFAKYALAFVINGSDKCKRFEEGLQNEIRAPVMVSMYWSDFFELGEATMLRG